MSLEKEAEDFKQKKTASNQTDRIAFRFYLGSAISGVMASSGGYARSPDDILDAAWPLALAALEKEKEF